MKRKSEFIIVEYWEPPTAKSKTMNNVNVTNKWSGNPYSEKYYEMLEKRKTLPVWQHKEEFLEALWCHQIMFVIGQAGSGKSTQIPQFVLECVGDISKKMIACTQPRTMAVTSLSHRVAEEMEVSIGEEVGYSIPFEDEDKGCSSKTVLKYLTDGMLLREAMSDPLLQRYDVIILDEVHERSLATDILLVLLKKATEFRPELRLVMMASCATHDAAMENLRSYFYYMCTSIYIPTPASGSLHHPVEIIYSEEPESDYVEATIQTAVKIHMNEAPGDVLVFVPKEEEIEGVCRNINRAIQAAAAVQEVQPVKVVPLYSTTALLASSDSDDIIMQQHKQVFDDPIPDRRKIVVSTDIAETSLTVDGIVYVIDPGLAAQKVCNPTQAFESLFVSPISKLSACLRSEHAGRTRLGGKCFRLYTEKSFHDHLQPNTQPEILRSNMASTVLTSKKIGLGNLLMHEADFFKHPELEQMEKAVEVLKSLGALDDNNSWTTLGEIMSEFPTLDLVDPQMSKMLIVSPQLNCSNEILSICAMLSVPANPFFRPREEAQKAAAMQAHARFIDADGDHLTLLNVYNAYKQNNEDPSWCHLNFVKHRALKAADNVRRQLARIMGRLGLKLCSTDSNSPDYSINIRRAILAGYSLQVAHLQRARRSSGSRHCYRTSVNDKVHLHPSSCLGHKPEWVVYHKCVMEANHKLFIRTVTKIAAEWLLPSGVQN